jgi:serine/threonine protein kinase
MSNTTIPTPQQQQPLRPCVQLKNYTISERLGSGSYGDVYKAHGKTGAREVVAVKCVLKSRLCKAEVDNIVTEISLLKKLKHPHIVEMKDFCWDAHYIYIIMDYCGGGDLSRFIKASRAPIEEDVCKSFLQQLASALKYLREENVAHMDLGRDSPILKNYS